MAKSHKKCSKNKHRVKSHRRSGKLIKSHCSKNPKRSKRRSNKKCSKKKRSKCRSNQVYVKPFMTKNGMTKGFCAKKSRSRSRSRSCKRKSYVTKKPSVVRILPKLELVEKDEPIVLLPTEKPQFRTSVGGGVGGCKAIKTESACGADPRCSYVNGACRARYGSLQGVQYAGPMGPPSARLRRRM
jgi:hypothetical protein